MQLQSALPIVRALADGVNPLTGETFSDDCPYAEPRTLRAIEAAGRALGAGIGAAVNVVDPGTVVLGGLYASLEPWLRGPLTEELWARAIVQRWSPVRVLASRLGPDAAVRGAAGAVVREVLSNPAAVLRNGTGSAGS